MASECSSTADSSPTSQSSSSSATEAALKAVSEGELLSNVPLEDTLTGSAGPAPSPAPSSCSLTPLSPLCRGGSLHLLRLPAGGGEHRPSHASTFSWSCCSTGSSVGAHSHLPDSLPYVFQEFDPPSEGQAEGQELLLTSLEGSITLGEQVTATPTQAGRQTGRHRLTSDP